MIKINIDFYQIVIGTFMQCISCKSNDFEIFSEDSWLKIPVSRCKKCHLMITGSSLQELVTDIDHNEALVVIHTGAGAAQLIASHLLAAGQ